MVNNSRLNNTYITRSRSNSISSINSSSSREESVQSNALPRMTESYVARPQAPNFNRTASLDRRLQDIATNNSLDKINDRVKSLETIVLNMEKKIDLVLSKLASNSQQVPAPAISLAPAIPLVPAVPNPFYQYISVSKLI